MTKTEKRVLAWVNRQRAELSLGAPLDELPQGVVNLSTQCPLARALHAEVLSYEVIFKQWDSGEDLEVPVPKYVAAWIEAFDERKYPHLVEVPREADRL